MSVWRYIDLSRLIDLLSHRRLYFRRVDLLDDPCEGYPTRAAVARVGALEEVWGVPAEYRNTWAARIRALAQNTFVNCWHLASHESAAMWKIYGRAAGAVAIVTTYQRLSDSVCEEMSGVGLVEYVDHALAGPAETDQGYEFIRAFMLKKREYSYEQEVRVLRITLPGKPGPETTGSRETGITLEWDPAKILTSVVVSPYADPLQRSSIEALVKRFAPELLERMTFSALLEPPEYR